MTTTPETTLSKLGAGTSAGTLGTLLFVAFFARDAMQSQLEAMRRVEDGVADLGTELAQTRAELGEVQAKLRNVEEASAAERAALERQTQTDLLRLSAELAELRECWVAKKGCGR